MRSMRAQATTAVLCGVPRAITRAIERHPGRVPAEGGGQGGVPFRTNLPGDAVLRDELDLGWMDLLNFVTALHEQTGTAIPEADDPRLFTLDGAVAYLRRDPSAPAAA